MRGEMDVYLLLNCETFNVFFCKVKNKFIKYNLLIKELI